MHSVVCKQVHGTPAPQTPQGCNLLRRSPPGTGKTLVDSDGFGCWVEGTQALSLPVPALQPPLAACTDPQPQACGNIWTEGKRAYNTYHFAMHLILELV